MVYEMIKGKRLGLSEPLNLLGKGPVLLIHGLNMDDFCMRSLKRRLYKEDWGPLYLLNLGKLSWTIEEQAQLLKKACEKIYLHYGPIHLVTHSMGGLVSRYYLQEMAGASTVASLVTLATPHFGTPMAHLALSTSGRQMTPNSTFMHRINHQLKPMPKSVTYLFLWSNLDIIVPGLWGGPWHRKWGNRKPGKYKNLAPHLNKEKIKSIVFPLNEPSIFQTVVASQGHYLGSVPDFPVNNRFFDALGGNKPKNVLLLPLTLGGITFGALYGDNGEKEVQSDGINELQVVVSRANIAFERLIIAEREKALRAHASI